MSFGRHYDPANVSFGPIVAHNDEHLEPGTGYDWHEHRGVEIVTWVGAGALTHEDSTGARTVLGPGSAQRLRAGAGVRHTERNDGVTSLRFVQVWLASDAIGDPDHASAQVRPPADGGLVTIASAEPSGQGHVLPLAVAGCRLEVARLSRGSEMRPTGTSSAAGLAHVFVVSGLVDSRRFGALGEGDAIRLSGSVPLDLRARSDAEVMVWTLPG
jgi:redox-sensitive bicupin YhaK (pirin superfamily)